VKVVDKEDLQLLLEQQAVLTDVGLVPVVGVIVGTQASIQAKELIHLTTSLRFMMRIQT